MFAAKKARHIVAAAVIAFSFNAAHADIVSEARKTLSKPAETVTQALQLPSAKVDFDPKKPLVPPSATMEKDGATVKIQPGIIPAPPEVHVPGNGFIADTINKASEMAQKPKKWAEQKGREINQGWLHLCNEIGMAWANFKHDVEKKVTDFMDWLIKLVKNFAGEWGVKILAGIGALFMVRAFFQFMLGRRPHRARHA